MTGDVPAPTVPDEAVDKAIGVWVRVSHDTDPELDTTQRWRLILAAAAPFIVAANQPDAAEVERLRAQREAVLGPPGESEFRDLNADGRGGYLAALRDYGIDPGPCRCTNDCGEGSEAGCPACVVRDIYDPCPAIGFGCGLGAGPNATPCDCCEPEQYRRALATATP